MIRSKRASEVAFIPIRESLRVLRLLSPLRRARRRYPYTLDVDGTRFRFLDPTGVWAESNAISLLTPRTSGPYEPAVTALLHDIFRQRPDACFADIGACIGFFTSYVATLAPSCRVLAFEPSPVFLPTLRRNIELSGAADRITLRAVALSDEEGVIDFAGRTMNASGRPDTISVEAVPLDTLRARDGLKVDVAKIDVHGGEGKVLRGMRETLARDVDHLFCEIHPDELLVDATVRDVLELLRESGLDLFGFDHFRRDADGGLVPLDGAALADTSRWTAEQVRERRMVYGRRRGRGGGDRPRLDGGRAA